MLHGWIRLFGDGIFAMRAMSALFGTIAILLLFVVIRELCELLCKRFKDGTADLAGAFGALLLATNLLMNITARTVRMYSLVTVAELAQMLFFVRLHRSSRLTDYAGAACFTALAIATNFTAAFLLVAEALG